MTRTCTLRTEEGPIKVEVEYCWEKPSYFDGYGVKHGAWFIYDMRGINTKGGTVKLTEEQIDRAREMTKP